MKKYKITAIIIILLLLIAVLSACNDKRRVNTGISSRDTSIPVIDANETYSAKALPDPGSGIITSAVTLNGKMYYILDNTVYKFDTSTKKHTLLSNEIPISSNTIVSLTVSSDAIWIAESNGEEIALRAFDDIGHEIARIDNLDIQSTLFDMCIDGNNNIYLLQSDKILIHNKDGKFLSELPLLGVFTGLYNDGNGNIYSSAFEGAKQYLYKVDYKKKTLSKIMALPEETRLCFDGDDKYSFYYTDNSNLYGINTSTGNIVALFEFLDCNINPYSVFLMTSISGDGFLCMIYDMEGNIKLYQLKADDSTEFEKKIVKMAVFLPDYYLTEAVLDFNRENHEYKIEIIDYSSTLHGRMPFTGGYMDDTMQTQLLLDIMTGDVPDIIDVSMLSVRRYAAKGLFEDLYYYLDNDPELSRDDILSSALELLETDGKLYQTLSAFAVRTAIGRSDIVGNDIGWTWNDIDNFKGGYKNIFFNTQDSLLDVFIYIYAESFIDWKTGTCSFDSPEFINLLNIVKSHPSSNELDFSQPWNDDYLLMVDFVDSILDLQSYRYRFNGDFTFKGYPIKKGCGNTIYPSSPQLAITSTSKYKDAAWSFVRRVLTEEYQSQKRLWRIAYPTNVNAFDNYLKDAMTPLYNIDENGNEVEIPKATKLVGNELIHLYAASESDKEKFIELINSCSQIDRADAAVYNIIWDECRAFLANDKTAEEAAKLIQTRVSLYVNEQMG